MLLPPILMAAAAALLLAAAAHDIVARTVPNTASVLVALIGLAARGLDGKLLTGCLAAAAVFLIAAFCWRRGWLGGADVKLLGAAALTVPPQAVPSLIIAISIAGSILAVLYLLAGRIARAVHHPLVRNGAVDNIDRPSGLLKRAWRVEAWRLRRGGPLPYACAIAAGFIFTLF